MALPCSEASAWRNQPHRRQLRPSGSARADARRRATEQVADVAAGVARVEEAVAVVHEGIAEQDGPQTTQAREHAK
jgi:hypothetical protein